MVSTKQSSIRFAEEDLAVIEEVQKRTGFLSMADALRYILRQYAQANGIELSKSKPTKKKR